MMKPSDRRMSCVSPQSRKPEDGKLFQSDMARHSSTIYTHRKGLSTIDVKKFLTCSIGVELCSQKKIFSDGRNKMVFGASSKTKKKEKVIPEKVSSKEISKMDEKESLSELLTKMIEEIIIEQRNKKGFGKKAYYEIALLDDAPPAKEEAQEEELDEMSAMGAGAVQGYGAKFPGPGVKIKKSNNK